MRVSLWRVAFWLCLVVVLMLAMLPPVPHMPTTGWDKSNHLLAFTVLAVLAQSAYPGRTMPVLAGLIAYGVLIEVLQSLTPDRFAEWSDWLADCLGLLLGWWLHQVISRKFLKQFGNDKGHAPGRNHD